MDDLVHGSLRYDSDEITMAKADRLIDMYDRAQTKFEFLNGHLKADLGIDYLRFNDQDIAEELLEDVKEARKIKAFLDSEASDFEEAYEFKYGEKPA